MTIRSSFTFRLAFACLMLNALFPFYLCSGHASRSFSTSRARRRRRCSPRPPSALSPLPPLASPPPARGRGQSRPAAGRNGTRTSNRWRRALPLRMRRSWKATRGRGGGWTTGSPPPSPPPPPPTPRLQQSPLWSALPMVTQSASVPLVDCFIFVWLSRQTSTDWNISEKMPLQLILFNWDLKLSA